MMGDGREAFKIKNARERSKTFLQKYVWRVESGERKHTREITLVYHNYFQTFFKSLQNFYTHNFKQSTLSKRLM